MSMAYGSHSPGEWLSRTPTGGPRWESGLETWAAPSIDNPWCAGPPVGSRNSWEVLKETRALKMRLGLCFYDSWKGLMGCRQHWLKQKGRERVWLWGQKMAAWGPEEPLRSHVEVISYQKPGTRRRHRTRLEQKASDREKGHKRGEGETITMHWIGNQDSLRQTQSEASWNHPQTVGVRVILNLHKHISLTKRR